MVLAVGAAPAANAAGASAPAGTVATQRASRVPADVAAAVARRPTDVLVILDNSDGLRSARAAGRGRLDRASRAAAAAAATESFAAAKRRVIGGRAGVRSKRDFPRLPAALVTIDSPAALAALAAAAGVSSVTLPSLLRAETTSNLTLIRQPEAVAEGGTGAGTTVAVIDTGVDLDHPGAATAFGNCTGGPATGSCRVTRYEDVAGSGADDADPSRHGTHVAATVAAVAPAAGIAVYNVFYDDPDFGLVAWNSDVLAALDLVADHAAAANIRSVNLSLGDDTYATGDCAGSVFAPAFQSLISIGVLPVAAAGNAAYAAGIGFRSGVSEPACAPGAVAVGAAYPAALAGPVDYGPCTDDSGVEGLPACFSQTGPRLNLLAPGVSITAAGMTKSGTSMAAPHVAAAAAILAGVRPAASVAAIRSALTTTGRAGNDTRTSPATRVNLLDVLSAVYAVTGLTAPGPPQNIVLAQESNAATVSWFPPGSDGGRPITRYDVRSSPDAASCTTGATGCRLTGLANGTAYVFTVTATNVVGTSTTSTSGTYVPGELPGPPVGVSALAGPGRAAVSWSPPGSTGGVPLTAYTVVASPGGQACTSSGSTSCEVTGLTNGVAYTFTATATNVIGTGAVSAASAAVVPLSVPGTPTAVTAVAAAGSATVSWLAPADSGGTPITGYTVVASPGAAACTTTGLTCVVGGLTNGTRYTFLVTTANVVGSSSAATSAAVVPATVPGAPAAPTAVRGDSRLQVSWRSPADTGGSAITTYTAVATPGGAQCATAAQTCAITGLVNGRSYTVTVTATSAAGTGAPSAASARVIPASAPGAPTSVVAQRGHVSALVTWGAAGDGGSVVTGYRVTASPGGRSCMTTGTRRCVVPGLVNGRAYRFVVTATNAVGVGAGSRASAAVVPAAVPGIPAAPLVVRGNTRVTASWNAPRPNGTHAITGYRVVATPGGRSCTATRARSCVVTGLVNGRRYEFTVVALNRVGAGPASALTAMTPAVAPGAVRSLAAAFPAAARTVLRWAPPASTGGLPVARFEYRVSADGGRTWGRWISAGTVRTATVTGLLRGRAYTVHVRAVTAAGAGRAAGLVFRPTR